MTLLIWRILTYISAGLFVAAIVLLFVFRPLKNRYYRSYEENEKIKDVRTDNSVNAIYFTKGETTKYIKKYVLCKTLYDTYLVCNFTRSFRRITFFVMQYNKRKRIQSVLRVDETNTGDTSKVIALNRRCAYVNVVIASTDDTVINADVIRPLSINRIRLYAFLRSLALFLGIFVARQALCELIATPTYLAAYLSNFFHYIAVGAALVLSVMAYFISVLCLRKKNTKGLSGGALEYDFL